METAREPLHVNRKEERKGSGAFASLLNKLGLGPTPGAAGSAIGVGAAGGAGGGLGGAGLAGGILATKAGIVALILAGTTIAAGIGVAGRAALSSGGGAGGGIWSVLPSRPGGSGAEAQGTAGGASGGASSSLDYMAQAAKSDPLLQESPDPAADESVASAEGSASNSIGVPDHTNAPANVGGGGPSGGARLAKMQGFAGSSGGSSGGSLSLAAPSGARNAASTSRVGGLSAMSRNPSMSAAGGRRALVGARGQKTSDALKFANNDGLGQKGARNPSMARAGSTFDGSSSGLQSTAAGVPTAQSGGGVDEGGRGRFSPNRVLDQRNVPQPPKVEKEKDVTSYKKFMYAAMAALGVAMLLGFLAGKKKDEAKAAMTANPLGAAALYQAAATMHWLAAAAAGVALAMGVILMTAYDQTMQGMIFTAIGGFLAFKNVQDALDASKGAKDAKENEQHATDTAKARQADIKKMLDSGNGADGKPLSEVDKVNMRKEYSDLGRTTGNSTYKPPEAPASKPSPVKPTETRVAPSQNPPKTLAPQSQPLHQGSGSIHQASSYEHNVSNGTHVTKGALNPGSVQAGAPTEIGYPGKVAFNAKGMWTFKDGAGWVLTAPPLA